MPDKKNVLREIFFFLSLTVVTAFLLTCLLYPFRSVFANRYLQFGFYQTVLHHLFRLIFPFIQVSAPLIFAAYFLHRTRVALAEKKILYSKGFRSVLILISFTVTAAGIALAAGISSAGDLLTGYSLLTQMIFGLVLVIMISLLYRYRTALTRKAVTVLSIVLVIGLTVLFAGFIDRKNPRHPNVVFIVVDTLRSDHTSMADPDRRTTGYLRNTLLPDSLYFSKGSSNSPWTLPSVASMITSRYPSQLGIRSLISKIDDREFTVAELMREEGYRTGAVISHILLQKSYGISQGFDYFNDRNISGEFGNHIAVSSPGVTEDALKFIRARKNEKFFLFLHYFDPHYIYLDHEKRTGYDGKFRSKDISFLRELIRRKDYSREDTEYLEYCYDTEIRFTDFYIGKVIEELKSSGIYGNTIIVFTSDHGEEFIERGWLGHSTTLYREQTGVPIIIKPAEHPGPALSNFEGSPVSNIDIVPTLISMAGLRRMPGLTGADLLTADPDEHTIFSEVSQKEFGTEIELVSVTWKQWKMIRDIKTNTSELFNTDQDPDERTDQSGIYPEIASKLKLKIQKWLKKMRKPGNVNKKRGALSESEKEKLKTLGYIN